MRFYKLHLKSHTNGSVGYEFFANREAADKRWREWGKEADHYFADIDTIDVTPTKAGILSALNDFAGHPNNG